MAFVKTIFRTGTFFALGSVLLFPLFMLVSLGLSFLYIIYAAPGSTGDDFYMLQLKLAVAMSALSYGAGIVQAVLYFVRIKRYGCNSVEIGLAIFSIVFPPFVALLFPSLQLWLD